MNFNIKLPRWLAGGNELSVLAPLLTIYTLAYLALMGLDFAARALASLQSAGQAQKLVDAVLEKGGITLTPPSPIKGEGVFRSQNYFKFVRSYFMTHTGAILLKK